MAAHARLAPSSAYRWMRCPGSVRLCANLPDESSIYASEGTAAHTVREECLRFGLDPWHFVGTKVTADGIKFEVTEAWARAMQPGIDRVREFGGRLYPEMRVCWSKWGTGIDEDQFGTLDTGVITPKRIIVSDFKFGEGVPVEVEENEQLQIYALGFYEQIAKHKTDADRVLFIIDQPRVAGGGGEWEISLSKLKRFGQKLKESAAATYDKDAPLVAGDIQCEWCPAAKANLCPAFTAYNMKMIGLKFKDLDEADEFGTQIRLPNTQRLTPEHRSVIVNASKLIRVWLEAVHADTLADALAGRPTPGLKAVSGRKGHRKWKDESKVDSILERALGERRFTKALRSPSQVEEIAPEGLMAKLKKFIGQGEGKPTLVPADKKGEAIVPTSSKFKNLDA